MKTLNKIEFALKQKESELSEVRQRLAELNVWIHADNFFKTSQTSFIEKVMAEKIEENRRVEQLQGQIIVLKWILE